MSNKTKARNIAHRLVDIGIIIPGSTERVVNEIHQMIHDDYIPGGKRTNSVTNIRLAPAGYRCGVIIGHDIQSGPYYCGKPATLIGDSENGVVCTCIEHEAALRRMAR